ncbi:MAG: pirin family protein [Anaerolineaceae bacterium]|nr:pirin family protein [Anaerolineaceae bacterium]
MTNQLISNLKPLGFTWETSDPFLFCVHHLDHYPQGNDQLGPVASMEGRDLGQDFAGKEGWRMYHGDVVPGFPGHPHRGFETITIVLDGFVDHSDSHGASGRYGMGDVQWMTAGSGLQHAEMFPLLNQDRPNRLELFQIWLNLPADKKFVKPFYKMLWAEAMTKVNLQDNHGKNTSIILVAGELNGNKAIPPAPDSWAADPENQVAIWLIEMQPGAIWNLPATNDKVTREIYYYEGNQLEVAGNIIPAYHKFTIDPGKAVDLQAGNQPVRLLLLQARPINEPVVQYGPFVMNTQKEIYEAYADYRKDQFGGWPWPRYDPVHPREVGRYARYADGSEEIPA